MIKKRCRRCRGWKEIYTMGGGTAPCPDCKATGFFIVEQEIVKEEKQDDKKKNDSGRKRSRSKKTEV